MTVTVEMSPDRSIVTFRFQGRLDISVASELRKTMEYQDIGCDTYVFDLSDVDEIYDSGLALLMMLRDRATKLGIEYCLADAESPEIMRRCSMIGMEPRTIRPQSQFGWS